MCDNDSMDDMVDHRKSTGLSRREFGAWTLGAGFVSMLSAAGAADMELKESDVEIKTPDGTTDAFFVHPAKGAHPAVLVWPDIFGLRPAFREMGKRLAQSGYSVLVVNPFYRTRKAPTAPEHADFNDPKTRASLMELAGTLSAETNRTDARAYIAWLDGQAAVDRKKKMGSTGYCMSGPFVFRTAAAHADRVGAGATFHGGGLVTDKPDSPHLLIPQIKARFLCCIASNDDMRQPEAKDVLKKAFAQAKLPAEVEVYEGALHGWCPPDSQVYNHDMAEKAWSRQLDLFKTALV